MSFFESDDENFNDNGPYGQQEDRQDWVDDIVLSDQDDPIDVTSDNLQGIEDRRSDNMKDNRTNKKHELSVNEKIINELKFDEWHQVTDCVEMDSDHLELALEEVIENMICYVMKATSKYLGHYPYSFREHLEEMCFRGFISTDKMDSLIDIINQLNTGSKVDEKIKIIQEYTGHTKSQITDSVLRAWNPNRRDKYDPERVGMPTRLCNTHLLDQIETPLESSKC
jgi:hypothetical protein